MKKIQELKDFSKQFILKPRLTKERIEDYFSDFLGFKITFNRFDYDDTSDFTFLSTLYTDNKLLYFDFNFLIDRQGFICITEFSFNSDNTINEKDYNLEIKGVSK